MQAFRDDLVAWRRAPFGGAPGDQDWVIIGENLAGAAFKLQLRYTPGDTGTALVTLAGAAAGAQGVSVAWDAGYIDPETGLAAGASTIRPQIDRATLEALATATDPTQPLLLAYDLHVTPAGGVEQLRFYGNFTVNPGVTI